MRFHGGNHECELMLHFAKHAYDIRLPRHLFQAIPLGLELLTNRFFYREQVAARGDD